MSAESEPLERAEAGRPEAGRLPEVAQWCVWITFGAVTISMIYNQDPALRRLDVLLFSCGIGSLAAALVWFFMVALQRSLAWSILLLIPLLNTLLLPVFVRMYWKQGTRAPALLALAGFAGELLGSVRMLLGSGPQLI